MKVMAIVKATQKSEAGVMPTTEELTEMGRFNQELLDAGVMLSGEGLHPTSKGVRISFNGEDRTITDGPFAETKELIAGFWMWEVDSMESAIEWARKSPFQEGELELRRVFEADDFGEEFTPELREQEEKLAEELARRQESSS